MKAKILIGAFVALALALAIGLGSAPSAAQGPTNDSPYTAIYADFQTHQIPAGAYLWYMFDYGGENKKINIFIPNGGAIGLQFKVFTPEGALNFDNDDRGVGRGNQIQVPCADGRCTSPDLIWEGAFNHYGTYFVLLMNPTNSWKSFQLLITGENVSHGIPTPTPAVPPTPTTTTTTLITVTTPLTTPLTPAQPVQPAPPPVLAPPPIPSPTPVKAVENDSPYTAVYVRDNRDQSIPANSTMWYKFDYGGDRSRIWIQLYNGAISGIWFAVFDPQQAINFTDDRFVGRGMTSPVLCDTGKCTGNDLIWVGTFTVPGTYFIRVTNPNDKPWTFKLHIEGDNINIIE